MKKLLLFLLLLLLLCFALWWKFCREETKKYPPFKEVTAIGADGKTVTVKTPYAPREIILSYQSTSDPTDIAANRTYLQGEGFVKVDQCDCSTNLELWRHPSAADDAIDLIGVIKDAPPAPPTRPVGDGLFLNFTLQQEPISPKPGSDVSTDTSVQGNAPYPGLRSILTGVVDGGVSVEHPNLPLYLWQNGDKTCNAATFGLDVFNLGQEPRDQQGHGTMVNGIVIGLSRPVENGFGTSVRTLNVRFTQGAQASGNLFDAICGIYYALNNGARVVNASWGFLDAAVPTLFEPVLKELEIKNAVLVAGIGNDEVSLDGDSKFWPACFATKSKNVIAVGAIDNNGDLATFSNWSTNPDILNLVAPGVDIVSTYPVSAAFPEGLAQTSGTSFATPFVTRTVAIRMSLNPGAPANLIRDALMASAAAGSSMRAGVNIPLRQLRHDEAVNTPF